MPGILILGGTGYSGRRIARHLLEHPKADVALGARYLDRAEELAESLNRQHSDVRARTVHADASQPGSLRRAVAGQSMVVVAAPTAAYAENIIRACPEMEVDHLHMQLFVLLQSRAEEIELAGRCFITDAGFHPGLPSALVRYAAAFSRRYAPCPRSSFRCVRRATTSRRSTGCRTGW